LSKLDVALPPDKTLALKNLLKLSRQRGDNGTLTLWQGSTSKQPDSIIKERW
jgi:hypothetical protein